MSESPPRVILHIGQHKTGTKALQYFLATHSDALATRGILYPLARPSRHRDGAYDISHYRLYALLRREILVRTGEALDASPASAEFWKSQRRFCDGHRSLRALLRAFEKVRARRGAHTLLLSAEDLFDMHTAHEAGFDELRVERGVELLAEAFRGMSWKPQIVLYLRRQDHLLAAHYAQFIVGSTINHSDFETFAQDFLPRLDFHALLAPWIRHFGAEAICVRPYESATLPAGVVHDFFDRVLGFLPPGSWHEPPCNPDFAHASPPRERV